MISNYIGMISVDTRKRFEEKEKRKIDVDRPAAVTMYNKFMGGRG